MTLGFMGGVLGYAPQSTAVQPAAAPAGGYSQAAATAAAPATQAAAAPAASAAAAPAASAMAPSVVFAGAGRQAAAAEADGEAQPAGADDAARIAEERATAKMMNDRFAQQCQTCKSRKYQDGSNDPGVSFKSPQHIDPGNSASVVMGHEQEHVAHEQARANQEGGQVVSQSVVLHGDICPECGRYYIAGGTTTTKTRSGGEEQAPAFHNEEAAGRLMDSIA